MYVCMYVYVCFCYYTSRELYVCMYVCIYVYIPMYLCVPVCMYVCMYVNFMYVCYRGAEENGRKVRRGKEEIFHGHGAGKNISTISNTGKRY